MKTNISFIVPTMNNYEELILTINSLKTHLKSNDEIVIVDSSTPKVELSSVIRETNIEQNYLNYVYMPAKGVFSAFNKGVKSSKNNWLFILPSGDLIITNSFNKVRDNLNRNLDILICDIKYGPSLSFSSVFKTQSNKKVFPHQSMIYKSNLHKKYGMYDDSLLVYSDQLFFKKIINKISVKYLSLVLSYYNTHGLSSTYNHKAFKQFFNNSKTFKSKFIVIIKHFSKYLFGTNFPKIIHMLRASKNYLIYLIYKIKSDEKI